MIHNLKFFLLLQFLVLVWTMNSRAEIVPRAAPSLSVHEYLQEVKKQHTGFRSAAASSEGGHLRSQESKLVLAPTFFTNAQYNSNSALGSTVFVPYDALITQTYSAGISQVTTFGLQGKLHYDLLTQNYVNPALSPALNSLATGSGTPSFFFSYANASPVLELTQNLWSNGFGRSTRAAQEMGEAQAMASSHHARFQAQKILVDAEIAYWKLALARETVSLQKEALDRAKKIHEWNQKQAERQLREESDVLQAEALRETRELDLLSSEQDEQASARLFNSFRNISSDNVEETLIKLSSEKVASIRIPQRALLREDVIAAQETAKASIASAVIATERDSPTLDAYVTLALNGQTANAPYIFSNLAGSIPSSFSFARPNQIYGIRFSVPLSFGVLKSSQDGWKKEQHAAEMAYNRKAFEQEQDWKNLESQFAKTKNHFELALRLEKIQEKKLVLERNRLSKGLTITYQVLLFEQDYLLSQLNRVRDQATLLQLVTQMKLFEIPSETGEKE